jgi:hypothetical protein
MFLFYLQSGLGMGETEFLWGNIGRRPLGRPRKRWEDYVKMDLRETGYEDGRLKGVTHDHVQWRTLVIVVLNLRVLLLQCFCL